MAGKTTGFYAKGRLLDLLRNEHGKFVQDLPHMLQVSLVSTIHTALYVDTKWPAGAGTKALRSFNDRSYR
jgi:hypothetical protein